MRSSERGKMLTTGVQLSRNCDASSAFSRSGRLRSTRNRSSASSPPTSASALRRPSTAKNRKRSGNAKYSWTQAVSLEAARRDRQHRFVVLEADGAHRARRQQHCVRASGRTNDDTRAVGDQLLADLSRQVGGGGNEERQRIDGQLAKRDSAVGPQAQADGAAAAAVELEARRGKRARADHVPRLRDQQRPEDDVMGAAELAGRAVGGPALGVHRAASRNGIALLQAAFRQRGDELCDRTGRHRRQEGRIDHFHQVLGEIRVARIELELHARREKRDGFDQSLDVRVSAIETVHPEPCCDARIGFGKLRTHAAQVLELPVVILEESGIHFPA